MGSRLANVRACPLVPHLAPHTIPAQASSDELQPPFTLRARSYCVTSRMFTDEIATRLVDGDGCDALVVMLNDYTALRGKARYPSQSHCNPLCTRLAVTTFTGIMRFTLNRDHFMAHTIAVR